MAPAANMYGGPDAPKHLTVVVPMAGTGSRFADYGFKKNKYLLPINLKLESMIEQAIVTIGAGTTHAGLPVKYVFIIRADAPTVIATLADICAKHRYAYEIVTLDKLTEGPASTVIEGRHTIDPDCPLVVSNSDQILDWSFTRFHETCQATDGCVLTYKPAYALKMGGTDKHSFVKVDASGKAVQFAEKIVLSDKALVGVHYFKKASYFFEAYAWMTAKNLRAPNGEFYLSLSYEAMLNQNRTVGIYELGDAEAFHPVGEPGDYFDYLHKWGGYKDGYKTIAPVEELATGDKFSVSIQLYPEGTDIHVVGHSVILEGKCRTTGADPRVLHVGDVLNVGQGGLAAMTACRVLHFSHKDFAAPAPGSPAVTNLKAFTRGWLVGNFLPSIAKTSDVEVGVLSHKKGEFWDYHYHAHMVEINVLVQGAMLINERHIKPFDKFVFVKNQISAPKFLDDCMVVCIKLPSVIGDKVML